LGVTYAGILLTARTCDVSVELNQWRELYQWLPRRYTLSQPKLIYSTAEHGTSLSTFFNRVADHEPTFIVIKTDQSEVGVSFLVMFGVKMCAACYMLSYICSEGRSRLASGKGVEPWSVGDWIRQPFSVGTSRV